jgi:plasmid stability protein
MGNMSIRNLPDETHAALKLRAQRNKRSAEAEVRALLIEAIAAETKGGFGTRLRAVLKPVEGNDLEVSRDRTPVQPLVLE